MCYCLCQTTCTCVFGNYLKALIPLLVMSRFGVSKGIVGLSGDSICLAFLCANHSVAMNEGSPVLLQYLLPIAHI